MTDDEIQVKVRVLEDKHDSFERRVSAMERTQKITDKEVTTHSVQIGNLDERQTKHTARHDGNYEKLDKKIDDSGNKIYLAINELSKKINENTGRDAVLKIIGGAFSGGVIVWVLKAWFT